MLDLYQDPRVPRAAARRSVFATFVLPSAQVMTKEPYASARRVYWIVDNGSAHRGQASVGRLQGRWPNLHLVHLPVHASWLNQTEIFFSILQRTKCSSPTTSPTSACFHAR